MFGLMTKMFSTNRKPARKATFRPQIEGLEKRDALSASSASLHAVIDVQGHSNVFYLNERNHRLFEGTVELNGAHDTPKGVQTLSAGQDAIGDADVFVTDKNGAFWQWNEGDWTKISLPRGDKVQSFAAVDGGRVYAIFQDNTLHEFDGFNWLTVPGSGKVTALDAVTDAFHRDTIFTSNADGSFGEFFDSGNGGYYQLASATHFKRFTFPAVTSFSAGTDLNGYADVYAKLNSVLSYGGGSFEVEDAATWHYLAPSSSVNEFSATNLGQCWFIASNNSLDKYDAFGNLHDVSNQSYVSLSAAASNDVYMVMADHSLWERTAGGVFTELEGPGTVLQ